MFEPSEVAVRPLSARGRALIFEDAASRALLAHLARIAPSDAPVLITGETGTGKELVARQLHAASRRADKPFVAVNAGAFSESLIESELFGHEKGAFTGAHASKAGWFEAAHGGSLFLDEIGDLALPLQVKLLRVLQEGELTRIGSREPLRVNVRMIAATNLDLLAAVRGRQFREDLYYRLRVAALHIPPLRERRADILPLARHFSRLYAERLEQPAPDLDQSAQQQLLQHDWPGNVRELENTIHHALLLQHGPALTADDLQLGSSDVDRVERVRRTFASDTLQRSPGALALNSDPSSNPIADLERAMAGLLERGVPDLHRQIEAALLRTTYRYSGRNQLETARLLGMSRNVVRARLIEYGELHGPLRRSAIAPKAQLMAAGWGAGGALRIGYQKLGLLMMVKGYGAFDAALAAREVRTEWVEYAGGIQIVEALRQGELAAGIVGDCPAVFAQAEDVPVVYVAAEPPAPRGTALIVPENSRLTSVAELRGKRVVVNRAAQAHYLLVRSLEEAGVDPGQVSIQFEPPDRALRAFESGDADAWSIWDPWLSSARLDRGARVLRDAHGLFQNSAYYLARRDFAEQHPDLLGELLSQVQLTAQRVKADPERAAHFLAPTLGFSPRALIASFERELQTVPLTGQQIAAQQDIADTLLRLRLIQRPVTVSEARWPSSTR